MSTLDDWTIEVIDALDVPAEAYDRDLLLDLTRDVAHGVARPAAPLTAYLVGVAVGRADATGGDLRELVGQVAALAQRWADAHPAPPQ